MVDPVYSMTCPVPPAVPIVPMMARMTSFAEQRGERSALDADFHCLGALLNETLRRQNMLHFTRPDAEGKRAECAVRGRMGITADDRHAWQRKSLLRADDMDDALPNVVHAEERNAELPRSFLQGSGFVSR